VVKLNMKDFPRLCLIELIRKAVKEGKLFELVFTEEGKRLRERVCSEKEFKKMVRRALKEGENERDL